VATRTELSDFLASVERRAFKQAVFAVRDEEAALDIVQDCMMRLTEKYGRNPAEELPLLFQRILQNAIRDYYRRARTRMGRIVSLTALMPDDDDADPLEILETEASHGAFPTPHEAFSRLETIEHIEKALQSLSPRQREAFLLRYWEGLDIAETAAVMGCTEGSVKTHCSRATQALAAMLSAHGIHSAESAHEP
jgi:RNA polymerase sigma-70 factor (ECF subfamily)